MRKNCNKNITIQTNFFQICFLTKYKIFRIKKLKVKKYLLLLFDFFSFLVFLSLFLMFFFCLLLCQEIVRLLASFLRRFFFVFKENTLQYLKKIQVQITVFNKNTVVKISRISNSKSPP